MAEALIEKHDWHLHQADAYETAEPGSVEYDASIRTTVDSDRETRRQLKLKVRLSTSTYAHTVHTAPCTRASPMMKAPMMPTAVRPAGWAARSEG